MLSDTQSVTQLSQVIGQVTAPAFLLGAVAAFTSVLISRMNRIIDRSQALNAIRDDDASKAHLKSDIPRLKRRAEMTFPRHPSQFLAYPLSSLLSFLDEWLTLCAHLTSLHRVVLEAVAAGFRRTLPVMSARQPTNL